MCHRRFHRLDLFNFHIENHGEMKYICPESGCKQLFFYIKCLHGHFRQRHKKLLSIAFASHYTISRPSSLVEGQEEQHFRIHQAELAANSENSESGSEASMESNVKAEGKVINYLRREQCEDGVPKPYAISKRALTRPECQFCGRHLNPNLIVKATRRIMIEWCTDVQKVDIVI